MCSSSAQFLHKKSALYLLSSTFALSARRQHYIDEITGFFHAHLEGNTVWLLQVVEPFTPPHDGFWAVSVR